MNLYHDQLTKIVGIVISGPQSNIQTSDSVMFFPEDIQFIRQGRELKTMSNRYGLITFDTQTQSTNWELNISGSLPAIPPVASAQPSLPPATMLAPRNHTTSMVMSQAAPPSVIRQPGFGTSSPPPNPFLSGIQENLSR